MARIRTIKPEFWSDERIVELDPWERLLFIGLWNFADDQGYIDLSVRRIKMQIFPGDTYDVSRGLASLHEASLVQVYQSPRGYVLLITNWGRHQRISNPSKPKYKPGDLRKLDQLPDPSRALTRPLESYAAEGKGKEGKGEEPLQARTELAVVDAPAPVDNPTLDEPEHRPEPAASATAPRRADRDQIDRQALADRIRAASRDRAEQTRIAAQIVAVWTDATESESGRLADFIRVDRQPTNVAAVTLAIADAGELPGLLKRVRAEPAYRHGPTGALATISREPGEVGKPPDLSGVRAQLAAASARARAADRPDPLGELRAATNAPDQEAS